MINVKNTIYKNINYRIDRLRKLADNNPSVMKKILYLTILDDLFDWADFKEDSQEIQRKLQDCRLKFILNNHDIFPEYDCSQNCTYVNVNIPRANSQWKRIWDSKESCFDSDAIISETCFTVDPTYVPTWISPIPYIKDGIKVIWIEDDTIYYNKELLTVHEMMDYYRDEQGRFWHLNPKTCEWERAELQQSGNITDEQIKDIADIVKKSIGNVNVAEIGTDDKKLQFTIGDAENNIIDIMDQSDLQEILK